MRTVIVRGVELGAGPPKIIVPLTAATTTDLLVQAAAVAAERPDLVEWRLDRFDDALDPTAAVATGRALVEALAGIPLLVTFRTTDEGGGRPVTPQRYAQLYAALIDAGVADLVDVEILREAATVDEVIAVAHGAGVAVVASSHDFDGTPEAEVIVQRLLLMAERGADVLKIAVMARDPLDVLTLLQATWSARGRTDRPVVTVSMGGLGVASRLAGGVFGSAATFARVGGASAPGQVEVGALRAALALVHPGP